MSVFTVLAKSILPSAGLSPFFTQPVMLPRAWRLLVVCIRPVMGTRRLVVRDSSLTPHLSPASVRLRFFAFSEHSIPFHLCACSHAIPFPLEHTGAPLKATFKGVGGGLGNGGFLEEWCWSWDLERWAGVSQLWGEGMGKGPEAWSGLGM